MVKEGKGVRVLGEGGRESWNTDFFLNVRENSGSSSLVKEICEYSSGVIYSEKYGIKYLGVTMGARERIVKLD